MRNFEVDLKDSARAFKETVWPKIKDDVGAFCFGGGELIQMETSAEIEFAKKMDIDAGVDAWQIMKIKNMNVFRSIGSRVQTTPKKWSHRPFNTFTIRKERQSGAITEYEKRDFAIKNHLLYPEIYIHAYLLSDYNGQLLSVGICKTKDVIECIDKGHSFESKSNDGKGWATFYAVYWDKIEELKYSIFQKTYPIKDPNQMTLV